MIEEVGKRYHTATIYRFIEASNYSLQVLQEKAIQKSRYEQNVYRGTMMSLSKGKDPSIFCFVDESAVGTMWASCDQVVEFDALSWVLVLHQSTNYKSKIGKEFKKNNILILFWL